MTYEELQKAFDLSDEVIESYKKYAALLKEWNEKINLTSITEESEVIEKHFYDSLLPTKEVKFQKGAYLDMGTGAGFPGMVIAIAHPELYVTLADSTKKKFIFLQGSLFSSKASFPSPSSIFCVYIPYFSHTSHRSPSIIYNS